MNEQGQMVTTFAETAKELLKKAAPYGLAFAIGAGAGELIRPVSRTKSVAKRVFCKVPALPAETTVIVTP